jgi:hypothetical protein
MSDDRDDKGNRDEPRRRPDYEVGRNRPPKQTRFRKGQSGNRKGRPKGSRNMKSDLVEELSSGIAIHEDGKKRIVPKQRAMIKRVVAQAIQGDTKAVNNLISMLSKFVGEEIKAEPSAKLDDAQGRVLESYRERLKAEILEELRQEERRTEDIPEERDQDEGNARDFPRRRRRE